MRRWGAMTKPHIKVDLVRAFDDLINDSGVLDRATFRQLLEEEAAITTAYLAAYGRLRDAVIAYILACGLEHEEGCPEDSTCACTAVRAIEAALKPVPMPTLSRPQGKP
jgi:hypothetical protein